MIRYLKQLAMCSLCLLSSAGAYAAGDSKVVYIGTAQYIPSINAQMEEPTTLLKKTYDALSKGGLSPVYVHYGKNWGAVWNDLQSGRLDGSIWWVDTPERKKTYYFPSVPLITFPNSLTGLEDNQAISHLTELPTKKQMQNVKVGQIENFWLPAYITEEQVVRVKDREALVQGLLDGDYDIIVMNEETVKEFLGKMKKTANLKKVPIERTKGYLMISNKADETTRKAIMQANDEHMDSIHS